jgi:hypothetical protein
MSYQKQKHYKNLCNNERSMERSSEGSSPQKYIQYGQGQQKQLSQEELCTFLTEKLRNFKNVTINTRKIENSHGVCYGIDVKNYTLGHLGNSVFHSLSLRTVSHTSRIINIKLVFNDNEQRNTDMKINADAITQIFREIANTTNDKGEPNNTLETVRIEEFEDERHNKHLSVIGESTKGASLIYTYLRTMDFVRTINEKYCPIEPNAEDDIPEPNDNMTPDEIDAQTQLLEKKLKALTILRNAQKQAATTAEYAKDAEDAVHDAEEKPTSRPISPKKLTISIGDKVISKKYSKP